MKIIKLQAENFKKIKAIEIIPKDNTIIISGRNGQGKTSILDAIWIALEGRAAAKNNIRPIRDGEDHANVVLEIDDMIITRKWADNNKSILEITNKEGAVFKSPQALLDKIIGKLSFNPLHFSLMKPDEQKKALIEALNLDIDLNKLDEQHIESYGVRTMINRDIKNAKGHLKTLCYPGKDQPKEEISIKSLTDDYTFAISKIRKRDELNQHLNTNFQRYTDLGKQIEQIEAIRKELNETMLNQENELETVIVPDLVAIQQELDHVDETNKQIRDAKEWHKVKAEITKYEQKSQAKTDELIELEKIKLEAIRNANIPIEGLGYDETGVIYNSIPLKQCSASEQLKISMSIAMAANPELRVIRITDGSLIDSENMKIIEKMATDKDFQIWLEAVDESGKIGIYIEDGEIKNNNYK